jgi:hypothetical protein
MTVQIDLANGTIAKKVSFYESEGPDLLRRQGFWLVERIGSCTSVLSCPQLAIG